MDVGIERLALYAGRFQLDLADLAAARGIDPGYLAEELMCDRRSVAPPWEDAVTLAVNATQGLLSPSERADVELLIVATESGVDHGKPISTWVHRYCSLPARCRNFEVKHACYGCTGALKMAASWIASGVRPGKKAVIVNTDLSRCGIGDPLEPLGGACAVAMLVSADPQVLAIDLDRAGYWTSEIADNLRPTGRVEIVADLLSVFSYLDALDGAYEHYEEVAGPLDYAAAFRKHIYHAPFPGMTWRAHRTLLGRGAVADEAAMAASFREKVADGLHFARRIGSSYGGSTMIGLLGLLHCADDLAPGDRISLFAYGGGCQGEFYSGVIGPDARRRVRELDLGRRLDERHVLSVAEYERFERDRDEGIDRRDYAPACDAVAGAFDRCYAGSGLLRLRRVSGYVREYEWC